MLSRIINLRMMMLIFSGFFLSTLTSCTFLALQKNVEIYEQQVRLSGQLRNPSKRNNPVIVLLYEIENENKRIVSYLIYHKPDRFEFMVQPGQYFISAFEDANRDLQFQSSEWAGHYGSPSFIKVNPGQDQLHLDLTLLSPGEAKIEGFIGPFSFPNRVGIPPAQTNFGEIVKLEEDRFSEEKGRLGLWEPIRFLEEVGGGLYFLESFNSAKIPVIFIHGAGGTPQSWTHILQRMDRRAFQPWLFFYPSGLYLDDATELFRQAMSQMALTYRFEKLIIVAHSMGGLIARAGINLAVQKGLWQEFPLLFITISTPWGGIQGAKLAVDHSTIGIIPSWFDLAPGSPFQQKLFETHLPSSIHHYLFFSFKGGRNPFFNENNDGTVPLASQLTMEAQNSAEKIMGVNEGHTDVLVAWELIAKLNEIFKIFKKNEPGP